LTGFENRVIETREFTQLTNGQIAIINADSIEIVDELIAYTKSPDTWAFYFLDPYGPSGIPYGFVKKIVSQTRHDVMLNFIYEDLLRKTGLSLRNDIKPELRQLVDNWSEAFGGDFWKEIARNFLLAENEDRYLRDALGEYYGEGFDVENEEQRTELKEQRFISAYRDVLHSMDSSLVTKLVNLRFGDRERTMFYLYLTTHDPTGALELNKILYDAKYLEHELRYRLNIAKRTAPPPGQLTLIPVDIKVPDYRKSPRPTPEEIEEDILKRFVGQTLTRKDVYRELVNTDYFHTEVDQAIRHLRKREMAKFDAKLNHKTLISFG
jgi:three-Cys-motif partner protein